MRTGWLTHAGPYKIEHVECPRPGQKLDLAHPPLALAHTTQGPTIEGALSVFRQHYAPHFTVGVDSKGRGRLMQHVPLGELAAALMNLAGGVETNREVYAQVEIVGYCDAKKLWLPAEPTLSMLAALMGELSLEVPLKHPAVNRNAAAWMRATGWAGHVDAPENTHYDPGKLNYTRLFQLANLSLEGATGAPAPAAKRKPRKSLPVGKTAAVKRAAKIAVPHDLCTDTVNSAHLAKKPKLPGPVGRPTLQKGATGPAVRTLQRLLAKTGARVTVDGDFGYRTLASVTAFQRRAGLPATGIVNAKTWAALDKAGAKR